MDQNEYPRPDVVTGIYPKDKTWGIVIIVLSALGICIGLAAGAVGGVLGAAGAGTAAVAANGATTPEGRDAAVALGAGGGLMVMLGFALIALSIAQLIGGVGVMKSQKWGFLVTGGFAALSVLMNLFRLPSSIIGIAISGVILWYCYSRVSGKMGPIPV